MDGSALVNVALALGVTIALVLACGWLARRVTATGGRSLGQIRVLASMPVGSREKLLIVDVAGEHKLIGVTTGQITDLGPVAWTPPVAAAESGFKAALAGMLGGSSAAGRVPTPGGSRGVAGPQSEQQRS